MLVTNQENTRRTSYQFQFSKPPPDGADVERGGNLFYTKNTNFSCHFRVTFVKEYFQPFNILAAFSNTILGWDHSYLRWSSFNVEIQRVKCKENTILIANYTKV